MGVSVKKMICRITAAVSVLAVHFFAPVFLFGQSQAAELETLLEKPVVSYAEAARFISASAEGETELPRKADPEKPISLGELSFLLMKAHNIKGGLMYAVFPGPRYAFRTMVSRSLIQGAADPAMTVSGERFLHILGNVLTYTGGDT
jgi:hypothetical protein